MNLGNHKIHLVIDVQEVDNATNGVGNWALGNFVEDIVEVSTYFFFFQLLLAIFLGGLIGQPMFLKILVLSKITILNGPKPFIISCMV